MSEHNFLYLIWKNPNTRRNFTVGKLTKDDKYRFEYCEEYKMALDSGWKLLEAFPEEKEYTSQELFAAFACRLPDRKRRNIKDILKKYNLSDYDGYELLKRSSGRLPIDTYEFVDPIFSEDEIIEKDFYIVGVRYLSGCEGTECTKRAYVSVGDMLQLLPETTNKFDQYAIKVLTTDNHELGYIPRYYSKSISIRLKNGMSYSLEVIEKDTNESCESCIKVRLKMPKK